MPTMESNEGKFRLSFSSQTHVARTVKTANGDSTETNMDSKREGKQKPSTRRKRADKRKKKSVNRDRDNDLNREKIEHRSMNKQKIFANEDKMQPIANGLIRIQKKEEDWVEEFHREHPPNLEIEDNLIVVFDRCQSKKSFKVLIKNNTWHINTVRCNSIGLNTVKLCGDHKKRSIEPRGQLTMRFEAAYVSNTLSAEAKISFEFKCKEMKPFRRLRTVKIVYDRKGPTIQRDKYDIPVDLKQLLLGDCRNTAKVMDALDVWVSLDYSEREYVRHFHNLIYLDEIGLAKEITDKYNKKQVHFGHQQTKMERGRGVSLKYDEGIYDLPMNDLHETRSSLQIGDKVIARKLKQSQICYEGSIIDTASDLIMIKFDQDFVKSFDYKSYSVEFTFSRSRFIRMHHAVDLAFSMYGIDFLMPKKAAMREKCLLNVTLNRDQHLVRALGNAEKRLKWFNRKLNAEQRQAVVNVLRGEYLNPYIIYGPPGTGKTTTLCEIVLQILANFTNSKIVITTQNNSAADLITERVIMSKLVNTNSVLRLIGLKYARASANIPATLDGFWKTIDDLQPGKQCKLLECLNQVQKYRVVVGTSDVIAKLLEAKSLRNNFTHAIIDEAGQCTEIGVLIPMCLVGKMGQTVMAGDPMQMSPLIFDNHAKDRGLSVSMLSRLLKCYANFDSVDRRQPHDLRLISKLVRNYRALPSILNYYNGQFYNYELIAMIPTTNCPESKLLQHLSQVFTSMNGEHATDYGIHFVNVDGRCAKRNNSWFNIEEAKVIKFLTEDLLKLGIDRSDIGIVTPYALQVLAIESSIKHFPEIRVGTVEDFQGLERKVVLISTVRTCPVNAEIDKARMLGFVQCPQRINVAMSRARVMVIVVGKQDLLKHDEHWNALIEGCKTNKTYINLVIDKSNN